MRDVSPVAGGGVVGSVAAGVLSGMLAVARVAAAWQECALAEPRWPVVPRRVVNYGPRAPGVAAVLLHDRSAFAAEEVAGAPGGAVAAPFPPRRRLRRQPCQDSPYQKQVLQMVGSVPFGSLGRSDAAKAVACKCSVDGAAAETRAILPGHRFLRYSITSNVQFAFSSCMRHKRTSPDTTYTTIYNWRGEGFI